MILEYYIDIPAREGAPKTTLYVKIVAENESSLNSKPYAFILPGGPGFNHSNYKDYSCLQSTCNVVFHDPRGCGLSEKDNPDSFTMDNYIQDVDMIRQCLKLRKIDLIGKSYGAMCALGYTLRYPNYVDRLVLAAGSPSYEFLETAQNNFQNRAHTNEQAIMCEKLWNGSFTSNEELERFIEIMGSFYSYNKRHDIPVSRPASDYQLAYLVLNLGFSTFLRTFDFKDQLHEISCPTLILVGEEDWITDVRHSRFMAERIPLAELIVFKKSDHSMESDVPAEFFTKIKEMLHRKNTYEPRHIGMFKPADSNISQIADETTPIIPYTNH